MDEYILGHSRHMFVWCFGWRDYGKADQTEMCKTWLGRGIQMHVLRKLQPLELM